MSYSDSHVHLDSFQPEDLEIVFAKMKEKDVGLVMNVSINLPTSVEAIKLAKTYPIVYAAIGIHPGEAIALTPEIKKQLEELSGQEKVVAFGEVGLSYGRSTGTTEEQQQLFIYQLSLATNCHIPVDIHYSPDSHQDIIGICKNEKGSTGIVHGFSGTMEQLNDWLGLDYYISLGPPMEGMGGMGGDMPKLTDDVIKAIPLEKLITETDTMAGANSRWADLGKAPMGSPPDDKGGPGGPGGGPPPMPTEMRTPANVVKAAERIARVKGLSTEEVGNIATTNLKRLLKIK